MYVPVIISHDFQLPCMLFCHYIFISKITACVRSIEIFWMIWESMLWHVVTKGAVRGCCIVAILNFKHCYVVL